MLYKLKRMKLNPIHRSKRFAASGFTLIEISLVIALLLGLIAVVFMGLGSYREGADKAKCKMQLASVQKAVRSHANMNNMNIGATLADTDVFGTGKVMAVEPECPTGTDYTWTGTIPAVGVAYGTCAYSVEGGINHTLADIGDW